MRFQILFSSLFIKIVAFAVNNDYKGHIFYVKLTESFCAQILVCDKLRFFDTFGKKGAGTADGSEVNTVIFFWLLLLQADALLCRSFRGLLQTSWLVRRHPYGRW